MHDLPEGRVGVRIVEAEAYPVGDAAGHAFVGRTVFNHVLFGDYGFAHVYLSYGVSWLLNVSSEGPGNGAGVLIRAGEPIWGVGFMMVRRSHSRLRDLARGPGRLTQAMGINKVQDGADYFDGGALWFGEALREPSEIGVSLRIGITKNPDAPLRFYERESPFVSGTRRLNP
jgi:DNA-3-methyladenine glycosylase